MFKVLLNRLAETYSGDIIYIPDALFPLVTDWLCKKHNKDPRTVTRYVWRSKTLLPYDEEDILKSYQQCPIHVPERILEKSIVIEASLLDKPEPVKEVKKPKPKRQEVTRTTVKKRRLSFS